MTRDADASNVLFPRCARDDDDAEATRATTRDDDYDFDLSTRRMIRLTTTTAADDAG
jgi:uncharacterized caspase-like protein